MDKPTPLIVYIVYTTTQEHPEFIGVFRTLESAETHIAGYDPALARRMFIEEQEVK
jgi:hypothetical protein